MKKIKEEVIRAGRICYEKNLLAGLDGNISIKKDDKVYITASGVYKGFLNPDDIVILDMNGKQLEGQKKASSEYRLHLQVYRSRPDVNVVVHAHPPKSTALSIIDAPLIPCLTAEAYLMLGLVPVAPYCPPGDEKLAQSILPYVERSNVMVLKKHGALVYGNEMLTAIDLLEKTEMLSEKTWLILNSPASIENSVFSVEERKKLSEMKLNMPFKSIDCECSQESCRLFRKWREDADEKKKL